MLSSCTNLDCGITKSELKLRRECNGYFVGTFDFSSSNQFCTDHDLTLWRRWRPPGHCR